MTFLLQQVSVCPSCRGALEWGDDVRCAACGRAYSIREGIADLRPNDAEGDTHKAQQAAFFDSGADDEWEIERPRGGPPLHSDLLQWKFSNSIVAIRSMLPGASVLTVCGGSGMDAEFLARLGARVVCSDFAPRAAARARERAQRHHVDFEQVVADVEHLPFADRAFDFVYVHDGLHHLADPFAGIAEMARVAARGVSVTEPARAALTEIAARVGLAERVEEAGNPVERLRTDAIVEALRTLGFEPLVAYRYGMFYRHEPGSPSQLLSHPLLRSAALATLRGANRLAGNVVGNKLTVQAIRDLDRQMSYDQGEATTVVS